MNTDAMNDAPVSLSKGEAVSLSKKAPGLKKLVIGLGWDVNASGGADFDLDASAFLLGANGKCAKSRDFVFYGNLEHESGAVKHLGDNLTGEGEGDDEQIVIELSRVPAQYDRIVMVVNIYQCVQRKQDFGMIQNAFIRLVNAANNQELLKYDLSGDYQGRTAMIFGEVYRHNGEWKFGAIGEGTNDPGLGELARRYA